MDEPAAFSNSPLPNLASNVFEIGVYVVGVIVLVHAFRRARWDGLLLVTAMVCGFLLEWTNIRTSGMYFYGRFQWMLASSPDWVPACIAIAWGCIVYSVMRTTALLPLSRFQRPFVCALLALILDLALDPVAANSIVSATINDACNVSGLGPGEAPGLQLWTWCVTEKFDTHTWYGVPLGNFFGWMAAIFGFTTAIVCVEKRWRVRDLSFGRQLACMGALVAIAAVVSYSLLGLYGALAFKAYMPEWLIFTLGFGGPVIVTIQMIPRVRREHAPEWIPLLAPLLAFAFCTWAVIAADAPLLRKATFAWSFAAVVPLGLYLYFLPYRFPGTR